MNSEPKRSMTAWHKQEEKSLVNEWHNGQTIGDIATRHQRTKVSILYRLYQLGLITKEAWSYYLEARECRPHSITINDYRARFTPDSDPPRPVVTEADIYATAVLQNKTFRESLEKITSYLTTKKETTMKTEKLFELVPHILGRPAANYTNAELFDVIADAEAQIAKLKNFDKQPKAMKKLMKRMEADLNQLVEWMDSREGE